MVELGGAALCDALDAVVLLGCLLLTDEACLAFGLLLDGAVDDHVGLCDALEAELACLVAAIEADGGEVVGVVADDEALEGVLAAPLVVGHSGSGEHLVAVVGAADGDGDALRGEDDVGARLAPEGLDDGGFGGHLGLGVGAGLVHLDAWLAGGGMREAVPLVACPGILLQQLVAGGEAGAVGGDELEVGARGGALRRHVLAGEVPVLVEHLLLESAEDALDGLGCAVVGAGGAVNVRTLVEEACGVGLAVASLVVVDELEGEVTGALDGTAEGVVLRLVVLGVGDPVAEEDLGVCVDDLIDRGGADAALVVAVVEVELGAVAVPEGVAQGGKGGLMAAVEELGGGELAVDGVVPLLDVLRVVVPLGERLHALQGLPSAVGGSFVVALEDLRVGEDGRAASLEGDEQTGGLGRDLRGVGVADLGADDGAVGGFDALALACVLPLLDPCLEARQAGGEGVGHDLAVVLRFPEEDLPYFPCPVAEGAAHGHALLVAADKLLKDGGVGGVLLDEFGGEVDGLHAQLIGVVLVEFACGGIGHEGRAENALLHSLGGVAMPIDVGTLQPFGEACPLDEGGTALSPTLAHAGDGARADAALEGVGGADAFEVGEGAADGAVEDLHGLVGLLLVGLPIAAQEAQEGDEQADVEHEAGGLGGAFHCGMEEAEGGDAEGDAAHGGRDGRDDVQKVLHNGWFSWFFEKSVALTRVCAAGLTYINTHYMSYYAGTSSAGRTGGMKPENTTSWPPNCSMATLRILRESSESSL